MRAGRAGSSRVRRGCAACSSASCGEHHHVRRDARRRRAPTRPRSAAAGRPPARRRVRAPAVACSRDRYAVPEARHRRPHRVQRMTRALRQATGVSGVGDRDRADPRAQVLGQHRPDVERRAPRRRRAPSRSSSTRVRRATRRGERQAVVPAQVAVDEAALVGDGVAQLAQPRAHRTARLQPLHQLERAGAQVAQAARCGGSGSERPHSALDAGAAPRRSPAQPVQRASGRPRTGRRGGRTGRRGLASRAHRRACAARSRPESASSCTTRGTRSATLRHAGQRPQHRRLVRQRRRARGTACLTTNVGPPHAVARKTRWRRDTSAHRQLVVDDRTRLDKAERQEIVGDVDCSSMQSRAQPLRAARRSTCTYGGVPVPLTDPRRARVADARGPDADPAPGRGGDPEAGDARLHAVLGPACDGRRVRAISESVPSDYHPVVIFGETRGSSTSELALAVGDGADRASWSTSSSASTRRGCT